MPKTTFHAYRLVITAESFLLAEGRVQIGEGNHATLYEEAMKLLLRGA
ncbi:hypothetical protein OKA05_15070 [Luteolibacter arcticus]|uniref:Uncharacterized protein n=1 Tax=Luteolibacter arcticus TaxID=1581411 RepID=A0ABT3GK38_9BACT|nr:hypothetical protein [Luteolibacter arcticus]MCW1923888.1 hypothetical protein [Luteolibacter arcticus]